MTKKKKPGKTKTVDDMPAQQQELRKTTSSPVYPAVSAPDPTPLPTPPPPPHKSHRKGKQVASWAAKVGGVVVTALISGFSSYQSSKSDQEGGYEVTATAVKELQDAVKELVKQQAYTQGQLDAMRNEEAKRHGEVRLYRHPPPADLKDKVVISNLPLDLGSAVKSKGRPMEQQVLNLAPPDELFSTEEKVLLKDAEKKRALAVEEAVKKKDAKAKAAEEKKVAPAAPP